MNHSIDTESLLTEKGTLSYDPDQGLRTLKIIPGERVGCSPDGSLLHVDELLEDATIDELPETAYPLIPPVIFEWRSRQSVKMRAQAAHSIKTSKIFYDEFHAGVTRDFPQDLLYSRAIAWYLVTRIAGDVQVKVRLANLGDLKSELAETYETISASELLTDAQKAMLSLRNAYMVNFKGVCMRILHAHMPGTAGDVSATVEALKPKIGRLLKGLSKEAYDTNPRDLWASHASWFLAFTEFCESSEHQRAVLFREIMAAEEITRITASLGGTVVGGSLVDPDRGQILRGRYILEPILDMIARGFIEANLKNKTLCLTGNGFKLHQALAPLKDDFWYYSFVDKDRDEVDPARIDDALAWIIEFFTKAKAIADRTESTENA